jgi:quinol monooxygenase YgiN
VIAYVVNLFGRGDVAAAFREWLDGHVREIVALPGFLGAEVFERRDPAGPADELALCVQYRLRDAAALEDYFREHAPRMRADGLARFGEKFRAERRVLASLARY